MKLLELAEKLHKIYTEHGDIDVLVDEDGPCMLRHCELEISEGDYPKSWNMPKGLKFVGLKC